MNKIELIIKLFKAQVYRNVKIAKNGEKPKAGPACKTETTHEDEGKYFTLYVQVKNTITGNRAPVDL